MAEYVRVLLHQGTDPFTPPQTMIVWIETSIPFVKQPIIKTKRMISKTEIIIEGPDDQEILTKFQECMKKEAIKSLIVGVIVAYHAGGKAGIAAALTALVAGLDHCVELSAEKAVEITGRVVSDGHWSDWE